MEIEKDEYFTDDCIIQDSFFLALKDLLICHLCNKILKEPYMCNECQNVYCKKCLENYSQLKICPNENKESKFISSITKKELLSKLKYRCKNCLKEVNQPDINSHLELNCEHNEIKEKEKTLAEVIHRKKELIKLSKEEMINKEIDNKITSKKIFNKINLFFNKYSNNFGSFWCR